MSHMTCIEHGRRASVHNRAIMHHDASRCSGDAVRSYPGADPWIPGVPEPMTPEERLLHAIFTRAAEVSL